VQALVFDFDGTLVDTETPELTVWKGIFAEYGVEWPDGYWSTIVGRGAEQEFERPKQLLERITGKPFTDDRLRHARTLALIDAAPVRPGVLDFLQAAHEADIPCAVASSSKHAWVDPALAKHGITDHFATVVCADDVARAKPFPDLYLEACRRLGTDPAETVAIEDSPNGLAAAKAAGLVAVATPNPTTVDLDLTAADLVIPDLTHTTLADLRSLVQRKVRHG
jgi:HAD superfamily hydrolase (TIGR01509 family)